MLTIQNRLHKFVNLRNDDQLDKLYKQPHKSFNNHAIHLSFNLFILYSVIGVFFVFQFTLSSIV